MKVVVPKIMLREKKATRRRTKKKGRKRLTPKMEKTRELVKEGYSIKKAMELAGYAKSTIDSSWQDYLVRLDLPELLRGLKQGSALLNYKAIKVLGEEMDNENSRERIRAADVAVKMGKLHLGEDKAPPKIVFHFQTIDKAILLNARGQADSDDQDELCIDGEAEEKD